jgi:hypothetical protein
LACAFPARAASDWEAPAGELAQRVEAILGPGQAQLTVRNLSSLPAPQVAPIRKLIEAGLKARGIVLSGSESANSIRVTLSENAAGRVWVAEVVEGTQTQVVIVAAGPLTHEISRDTSSILLQATPIALTGNTGRTNSDSHILAVLETDSGLVLLEPETISFYAKTASQFAWQKSLPIAHGRPFPRDARGLLLANSDSTGFAAYLPGVQCEATLAAPADRQEPIVRCKDSDDPWPIPRLEADPAHPRAGALPRQKAFLNTMRNAFTGVLTPGLNVDLAPFYSAAELPQASGSSLLVASVDGSVSLVQSGQRKPVAGARDWGSDFAILQPACAANPIVLVTGSGAAQSDSLRAYAIPALEAVPVSAPLAIDGTVTAIAPAENGGATVVVRTENPTGSIHDEVLRVAAICN